VGKIILYEKKFGQNKRKVFDKNIDDPSSIPNLIETQKESFKWFMRYGIKEILDEFSPIVDSSKNLILEILDFTTGKTKYNTQECKRYDVNYSLPLKIRVRLINKEQDEIKEQEVFFGEFPIMTETGTFIINGAERVIVNQLVRSPGIYFNLSYDKSGNSLVSATLIPNRGSWIEYETSASNILNLRIDKTRRMPITILLRAIGYETDEEILNLLGEEQKILNAIKKDTTKNRESALMEIYRHLRPGEPPTKESSELLFKNMFLDTKRYHLASVGRYKINKKLSLESLIINKKLAKNVVSQDGKIIAKKDNIIDINLAKKIQNNAIDHIFVWNNENEETKIIGNFFVDSNYYLNKFNLDYRDLGLEDKVYFPELKNIIDENPSQEELIKKLKENKDLLSPKILTKHDIVASINYSLNFEHELSIKDNIDHLGNRRIRSVGELLQNQLRIGMIRMERIIRERMTIQDLDVVTPQALINIRPITAILREFFGTSQLSQFMEQTNPLGELTHKRRLSALGPGGLSRDRAGFDVRDINNSHYGRMCPIETPEGANIGLINSLATHAKINKYGFIETPYRIVDKNDINGPKVTNDIVYVAADDEEKYVIAQANAKLSEDNYFINKKISGRYKEEIGEFSVEEIDLMDVSPKQMVSIATSLIPFLENDDVIRALMGSNMQRQAVPLIEPEAPCVGTGMEYKTGCDSGVNIIAKNSGIVEKVSSDEIIVKNEFNKNDIYKLNKYARSNQSTCINQKPLVTMGDKINTNQVIADGPSMSNGELALGKDILVGFMSWEGYNYEDAILLSERLIYDDVYTSVHIEEYDCEARDTKLGPEEITRDIPNIGDDMLKDLDEDGIVRIGAFVEQNDILVGKITPKGETELTSEERLLRAIFGDKSRDVRDTSLRIPHGEGGVVVDVKIFKREDKDELSTGVNKLVRVYIAQKRKISVGDKMAGRHGNKGVVSRILPVVDMPFMPNGRALDIVLNPLGVPSRMNIGQILETHLGLAAKVLNWKIATPVFSGTTENDIVNIFDLANDYANLDWNNFEKKWRERLEKKVLNDLNKNKKLGLNLEWHGMKIPNDGKIKLRDGKTGEYFDNAVTVGFMHYLKLHHLVDDKIHARSTGPYSLVTQQPLGGKAQFGGQRFGEMEVWALEAYGAAYTLQEILTIKSDDVIGRVKAYEAIVKGDKIPESGTPESFKVLVKELQSLALDVKLYTKDRTEVEISSNIDEDEDNDLLDKNQDNIISTKVQNIEDVVLDKNFIIDRNNSDSANTDDTNDDSYDYDEDYEDSAEDMDLSRIFNLVEDSNDDLNDDDENNDNNY
jgi:DNA-directed RNA polymerase subunit beta